MLIVVVIIGILASALIPRLTSAKGRAENTAAVKDVSDIVTALTIYQIDNGWYPVSASCNGTIKTDCTLSWVYTELSSYLKSIPQGNSKVPQWTIGNGNIVPAWNAYGYIGTGQRYILSYWFTDTRDVQRYKAVRMPDEKWWMAENLNFKTANSVCYDNIDVNCSNWNGRLYTWDEAQTACPQGWKLPSDNEWTIVLNKIEELYWGIQNHWNMYDWYGSVADTHLCKIRSDSFGMSILLAGSLYWWNWSFAFSGQWWMYWSSDDWRFRLFGGWWKIFHSDFNWDNTKAAKYSVRCIRD